MLFFLKPSQGSIPLYIKNKKHPNGWLCFLEQMRGKLDCCKSPRFAVACLLFGNLRLSGKHLSTGQMFFLKPSQGSIPLYIKNKKHPIGWLCFLERMRGKLDCCKSLHFAVACLLFGNLRFFGKHLSTGQMFFLKPSQSSIPLYIKNKKHPNGWLCFLEQMRGIEPPL